MCALKPELEDPGHPQKTSGLGFRLGMQHVATEVPKATGNGCAMAETAGKTRASAALASGLSFWFRRRVSP